MKYFIFLMALFIFPQNSYSNDSLENKSSATHLEILGTFHGFTFMTNGTLWDKELGAVGQKVYFETPPEVVGEFYTYVLGENNGLDEMTDFSDKAKLIYKGSASEYEPTEQAIGYHVTLGVRNVISITSDLELIDTEGGIFIFAPLLHNGTQKGDVLTIHGTSNAKNAFLTRVIDNAGTTFTTPMLRLSDNYFVIP